MSALSQLTSTHRNVLRTALAHPQVAQDICDRLDGTGRAGTAGSGATADERSAETHVTTLTYSSKAIATVDGGVNGAIGNLPIYTFPEGLVDVLSCVVNLTFTCGAELTTALKFSVGSAPAATNDTLDLLKANVVQSTAGTITASAGSMVGVSKATALTSLTDNSGGTASSTIALQTGAYVQATQQNTIASLVAAINSLIARDTVQGNQLNVRLDGTSSAAILYLNVSAVDANSTGNSTVTISGTIIINWRFLGDK